MELCPALPVGLSAASFALTVLCLPGLDSDSEECLQVMYSDFLAMVNTNSVHSARIDDSTSHVYFRTRAQPQPEASNSAKQGQSAQQASGTKLLSAMSSCGLKLATCTENHVKEP